MLSVLYQWRYLLVSCIGFILPLIVAVLYNELYHACVLYKFGCDFLSSFTTWLAADIFLGISLFGLMLLAAALGVGLAVWWRQAFLASLVSLATMLVILVAWIASNINYFPNADWVILWRNMLIAPLIYLAAIGIIMLARSQVRREM